MNILKCLKQQSLALRMISREKVRAQSTLTVLYNGTFKSHVEVERILDPYDSKCRRNLDNIRTLRRMIMKGFRQTSDSEAVIRNVNVYRTSLSRSLSTSTVFCMLDNVF